MRKGFAAAIAAVLLTGIVAVGLAIAQDRGANPVVVGAGNMVLRLNGDIEPKVLPKYEWAPLRFWGSAKLTTVDGSHPPALEESLFDADKDVMVSVEGLPACRIGQLQARGPEAAEAVCGDAIVGRGTGTVEVAFPDQKPFDSTGPLLFFNGGERDGVVKLLAYGYVGVPAPTAVIATAEIRRVGKGAFGLRIHTTIPGIAGGAGSVVGVRFRMGRVYTYKGRRRSLISGRCRDGRLRARGTLAFSDDSELSGSIIRSCTAIG